MNRLLDLGNAPARMTVELDGGTILEFRAMKNIELSFGSFDATSIGDSYRTFIPSQAQTTIALSLVDNSLIASYQLASYQLGRGSTIQPQQQEEEEEDTTVYQKLRRYLDF